jgi:hypothetical protein
VPKGPLEYLQIGLIETVDLFQNIYNVIYAFIYIQFLMDVSMGETIGMTTTRVIRGV